MLKPRNNYLFYGGVIISVLFLSFLLSWVASGFESVNSWGIFFGVLTAAVVLIGICFKTIKEPKIPDWLLLVVVGGFLLRLGLGAFWSVSLPEWGYGGEVEIAGYVMSDAFERDMAAWELSQSGTPLISAFRGYSSADQYGGLLFISALVYRITGIEVHQPLLIVVLVAGISSLAILFTWAFVKELWGSDAAKISAWVMMLYPEALLLGSSQMREGITMTLAAMGVYGVVDYYKRHTREGVLWVVIAVLLAFPISTLFGVMLIGVAGITAISLFIPGKVKVTRKTLIVIVVLIVLTLIVGFLGEYFIPWMETSPISWIQDWLRATAKWQSHLSERASGKMQSLFEKTPEWSHIYILLGYGIVRPFLPAALLDAAAPIWKGVAVWRSFGWSILLPFLIYAPISAARRIKDGLTPFVLSLVSWLIILIASYRAGGDQWDNPRYRAIFLSIQIAVSAWLWVVRKQANDRWFPRTIISFGLMILWFIPWYLQRITSFDWIIDNVFATFGAGAISVLLYIYLDIKQHKPKSEE